MFKALLGATTALAVVACGQQQQAQTTNTSHGEKAAASYSGLGKINAVSGNQVTIDHGPIEGLGWPAMTMTFAAPADIATAATVGSNVEFAFQQQAGGYVLTKVRKR